MKRVLCPFLFLFAWFLFACSEGNGVSADYPFGEDDSRMVLMKAKGSTVVLGTTDSSANVIERPSLRVFMDYDFYISRNEVTCGEFNSLMEPATGLVVDCPDDSLPATNMTYFDAVLFANELSKSENRDTAYTYSSKTIDSEKHCVGLEGIEYHPEIATYRLPTEAEWVFAARSNWDPEKAWTSDNSDYKLHPVCSKEDGDGLCDMMGNAMEWANDWLGYFRDTLVLNYVGAPDGGKLSQRVVKGGSFRNRAASLTLYARGDVYTIISSSRADYVGFRLAYGAIPQAAWMGNNGKASSSRVTSLINSSSVYAYTNSYKTKLVFRNDITGNLSFIDYSKGAQSVVEIADTIDSYHPVISPDGKRVAFCTMYEGSRGISELYVRDLNEKGTNLVKLDVESAAIPRWRVLDNGDTVIVYVTSTGVNTNEETFMSTSTWQVPFANGKFGVPQKLFDGAYHGGISKDNRLAVSGASLLRARVADPSSTLEQSARDTVWYNGERACNVSLAQDGSKRTMFLDFAGETGKKFVGNDNAVAAHQYLFIADSTGNLIYSIEAPDGTTFDHTEWANAKANIAVATLTNVNGAHNEIVLLNISGDAPVITLVKGEELWHPDLWSGESIESQGFDELDKDSACVYMTEHSDITTAIMKTKMELFWLYRDTTEVVIIGSSRSFAGVDPELIESYFAVNLSYSAEDLKGTEFFVENYILPLMPKIKYVVLTLDYDRWYVKDGNWNKWFSNIPGYEYDRNHGFWKDGVKADRYAISRGTLNPNELESFIFTYHRGLFYSETEGWGEDIPDVSEDPAWFDKDDSGMHFNLFTLTRILELCRKANVKVIGVVYPQSPNYLKTGAWGRYGPTREAVKIMQGAVDDLTKAYPNFIVMDENKDGYHDYVAEEFSNMDHLGLKGTEKMSRRLDQKLASW